jgi:hypothetical protein
MEDGNVTYCPEMDLIIACLPLDRNGTVAAPRLRALLASSTLDWNLVASLAGRHGMLPMLTHALNAVNFLSVPLAVRQQLVARNLKHVRTVLAGVSALVEVQGYFRRLRVQAVSWKGPSLGVDLYGIGALRESADLDLLVAQRNIPAAVEVLQFLEYKRHRKAEHFGRRNMIARLDREYCFYRERDRTYIELHTQILPSRFASWQDMRHSLQRTHDRPLVASMEVETLEPGDLLVSLCGHAIKHHWEKLKWLADVARFIETYSETLDWEHLARWTRRRGRFTAVLHSCTLAAKVFGVVLPLPLAARTPEEEKVLALTDRVADWLRAGALEPMSHLDTGMQLALLCQGRLSYLHFTARRLLEPQLVDLRDERHAASSPLLAKWRRIRRELSWSELVGKTSESLKAMR